MATPQTFTMAFPDAGFTTPENFATAHQRTPAAAPPPAHITRFEPV